MSAGRGSRNNVLAGAFVVVSIVLALLVIIILSNLGERLQAHNTFTVRFSVADGAEGLDKGAAVKLGGKRVGQVLSATFVDDPVSGDAAYIDVVIEVNKNIRLYSDADVELIKPLLGSGSTINIISFTGSPQANSSFFGPPKLLHSGDTISGRLGGPGFLSRADYAKMQNILARVDRITADVEPRVGPIMDEAREAVSNVKVITEDARARWQDWGVKIDSLITRAEKASADFEPIVKTVRESVDGINARVKDAQEIFASARGVIDDNRKKLDEIVENVRDLSAKAKGEGYDRVLAAVDSAKATMDEAKDTVRRVDDLLVKKGPELSEMITNSALAANQLKLMTVELRAAPWRLLYQPSKKELENELLYNSVRQYSDSVAQLRMAAESLRSVVDRGGGNPADQATVDAMTAKLKQSFDQYQEQERAFLNRWVETK